MKQKRGRKKKKSGRGRTEGTGVLSGIKPWSEEWSDIRNRITYDSAEWPLLKVRAFIGDGSQLPDNFLSAELAKYDAKVAAHVRERTEIFPPPPTAQEKHRQHRRSPKECWRRLRDMRNKLPLMPPILSAWRTLLARFERAVLSGDALASDWLDRQLKALRSMQQQEKIQFNAKVVYLLEMAMYGTQANQGRRGDQPKPKTNSELSKLIAQRKAEQAQLTPLERAERIRKRDAAAKAYEAWLNTPEGRGEQDPIKRHEKFFGSQPASRSQRAKQRAHAASLRRHRAHVQDDLTLTPAGKFTDARASDIFKALEKRKLPDGHLIVQGCRFENKDRVREAIRDLARQLQFALKKQH